MGSATPPQAADESVDGSAEVTSLQLGSEKRHRHGRLSDVTTPTSSQVEAWGHHRYAKSHSLPTGFLSPPQVAPMGES